MDYKQRAYKNAMIKRNEDQKKIKEFSESQACKDMLAIIREKAKPSIDIEDISF